MINLELDKQVVKLTKEYKKLYSELSNIEEQIEDLEYDRDWTSNRLEKIEEEIKCTKKDMLVKNSHLKDIE